MNIFKRTFNALQNQTGKLPIPYMPKLDGLRGLLLPPIVFHHMLPDSSLFVQWRVGLLGVTGFFVLSGFLITALLWEATTQMKSKSDRLTLVKNFLIRRALRLFPLYYLIILITFILNIDPCREYILNFITYTSNFVIAFNHTSLSSMTHIWSLAVEEQYYFIFAFTFIFIPLQWRGPLLVVGALSGIFLMYFTYIQFGKFGYALPTAYVPHFAVGGLAAVLRFHKGITDKKLATFLFLASLAGLCLLKFVYNTAPISQELLFVVSFSSLIFLCSFNEKNWLTFLRFKPIILAGKVSYGGYLIHTLITPILAKLGLNVYVLSEPGWVKAVLIYGISIAIATLTWGLYEAPIRRLRHKFKYS